MYYVQVTDSRTQHGLGIKNAFETRQAAMDFRCQLEQLIDGLPSRPFLEIMLWREVGHTEPECACPVHSNSNFLQAIRQSKN